MIRIQGIPVVAERLQAAHRDMNPRAIVQGIERNASLPSGTVLRQRG